MISLKRLTKLELNGNPTQIWNCDETGLQFVVKPNKIVTAVGKRYVYKRTYAERGETHTVLGCVNACGSWIPPLVIFKGVRWNDELKKDSFPGSLVKLYPKVWITAEIFLEWFQFVIESIPPARPVILLMDSHATQINAEVLALATQNKIFLFTFPAHTSHLLQPLDVGVYKALKSAWTKALNSYMIAKPTEKPNRYNFHKLFLEAYIPSFSITNITNGFKKTGIVPFNRNAIAPEALKPS